MAFIHSPKTKAFRLAFIKTRDVKQGLENRISTLEMKSGSTNSANEILFFFIFVKEMT